MELNFTEIYGSRTTHLVKDPASLPLGRLGVRPDHRLSLDPRVERRDALQDPVGVAVLRPGAQNGALLGAQRAKGRHGGRGSHALAALYSHMYRRE